MNPHLRRLLPVYLTLLVVMAAIPLGIAFGSGADAPPRQFSCPTGSGNSYAAGGMDQYDLDNPVRPAWNHADKNLALRSYSPTDGLKDFVVYGNGDAAAPQFATLFEPDRTPYFTSLHQIHNWNWAAPPNPGTRGAPITNPPVTVLGLETLAGEVLQAPWHTRDMGPPWGTGGWAVIFADADSVTLKGTREDSAATGYTVHIDGICTDPNLLNLYLALDNTTRNSYRSPRDGVVDYDLPGLYAGQVFGVAAGSEIRVAIADTGTFQDPRSRDEFWMIRPPRTSPQPPATATATPIPTDTPLPTNTPVPSNTPLPTNTGVPTNTPQPTNTGVPTNTPQPTNTGVPTNTPAPTSTPLPTSTSAPTQTPLPTSTALPTQTPSPTATASPTRTPTGAPTASSTPFGTPPPTPVLPPSTPVTGRPGYVYLVSPKYDAALNDNTPALIWKLSANSVYYRIQVDNDYRFRTPEQDVYIAGTGFTVPVPLTDGLYYWRVQGQNSAGGKGSWSTVWRFRIDTRPPVAPTLRFPANGSTTRDTTPTFTWRWVSDAAGFQIQVATDAAFTAPVIDKTVGKVTSYTPAWNAPLAKGATYFWRVRTRDAAGNWGAWSLVWSVTVQ